MLKIEDNGARPDLRRAGRHGLGKQLSATFRRNSESAPKQKKKQQQQQGTPSGWAAWQLGRCLREGCNIKQDTQARTATPLIINACLETCWTRSFSGLPLALFPLNLPLMPPPLKPQRPGMTGSTILVGQIELGNSCSTTLLCKQRQEPTQGRGQRHAARSSVCQSVKVYLLTGQYPISVGPGFWGGGGVGGGGQPH